MSEQTTDETTRDIQSLPLIVLDGAVIFPHTVATLPLNDETSPAAEAALREGRRVLLVARRADADSDAPLELQLHRVGIVARIEQAGMLPSGGNGIAVRGIMRAVLNDEVQGEQVPRFTYTEQPDTFERTPALETLMNEVHAAIDAVLDMRPNV
ncbi:MAG: LON peptidase substrate-binding domain-containing protein, partial [Chloroflexales bacterium]|nr:LON peptidase substrate-binding domain-containing protein [Chloroflexales bacterium]